MCRVKPWSRAFWKKAAPTTCSNDKFPNVKAPWQKTFIFILPGYLVPGGYFVGTHRVSWGRRKKQHGHFRKWNAHRSQSSMDFYTM